MLPPTELGIYVYYTLMTKIYCIETSEQYVQRNDDHMGTFSHIVGEPTKRFTIVN